MLHRIKTIPSVLKIPREPLLPVALRLCLCLFAPIAYAVSAYAAEHPAWAEAYTRVYISLMELPSLLIGFLPFSLAEIIALPLIVFLLGLAIYRLRKRNPLLALSGLAAAATLLLSFFLAGWGIAYHRLPLSEIAGLDVKPRSTEALASLCQELVTQANALREGIDQDENGVFLYPQSTHELLREIPMAYTTAAQSYPWLSGRQGAPKPVLLSIPLSHTRIAGIYIPFTLEANVNTNNTPMMLPVTACHEAAHQRGFAREDEANFIAYLVCRESGDSALRYSGSFLALITATNALYDADSAAYETIAAQYSQALRRDMSAHSLHWAQYQGKAAEIQQTVNDAYLKANNQTDGVRSYGRMVDLMLAERGID